MPYVENNNNNNNNNNSNNNSNNNNNNNNNNNDTIKKNLSEKRKIEKKKDAARRTSFRKNSYTMAELLKQEINFIRTFWAFSLVAFICFIRTTQSIAILCSTSRDR